MRPAMFGSVVMGLTVLAGSLSAQVPSGSAAAAPIKAEERKIEVRVDGRPTAEATVGSGLVTIDTVRLVVRAGDQVKVLLRNRGVVPDAVAIAWFYELNPAVARADELTLGSSVLLPSVTASDSFSRMTQGRISVAFVADTSYKLLLLDQATRIAELTDSLKSMRVAPTRTLQANSDAIERGVAMLARSSAPLSRETAAELTRGLAEYGTQVERAIESSRQFSLQPSLSAAGTHVASEVIALASASRAGENTRATLEIEVVDIIGLPRQNVRVVYVRPLYEGDRNRAESILKLSAQKAKGTVDLGPWKMWVEDLQVAEVSVKRELVRVRPETREVTLLVR